MKKVLIGIMVIGSVLMSCTDRDDEVTAINLRIKNESALFFDEVQVGEALEKHLNVAADEFSPYFEYETAYRYGYIEIKSGEETYVLQPIDYVGETPLTPGFYTYELDITPEGEVLLNFRID